MLHATEVRGVENMYPEWSVLMRMMRMNAFLSSSSGYGLG